MSAAITYAAYGVLLAAVVGLQVLLARRGSLTLGALARGIAARRTTRLVALLGWAWLGWHLFARGSVAFLR